MGNEAEKEEGKTASHPLTANLLHTCYSGTANGLQSYCKTVAVALQSSCSRTAKQIAASLQSGLQWHCKKDAATLQWGVRTLKYGDIDYAQG